MYPVKKMSICVAVLLALALSSGAALAADTVVKFDGGIGVTTAALQNGTFIPNNAQNVPPGGRPWVISKLKATVKDDNSIKVKGEGLLLAGGNAIGTTGGLSVFATLFCGGTAHSTSAAGVLLAPDGDFTIDDVLDGGSVSPCANPVLLIRNTANLAWFAAGIPSE
jgi:hypothetical protein